MNSEEKLNNLSSRGSSYRGVSKNGKKWQVIYINLSKILKYQVMIIGNQKKYYIGAIVNEELAA